MCGVGAARAVVLMCWCVGVLVCWCVEPCHAAIIYGDVQMMSTEATHNSALQSRVGRLLIGGSTEDSRVVLSSSKRTFSLVIFSFCMQKRFNVVRMCFTYHIISYHISSPPCPVAHGLRSCELCGTIRSNVVLCCVVLCCVVMCCVLFRFASLR